MTKAISKVVDLLVGAVCALDGISVFAANSTAGDVRFLKNHMSDQGYSPSFGVKTVKGRQYGVIMFPIDGDGVYGRMTSTTPGREYDKVNAFFCRVNREKYAFDGKTELLVDINIRRTVHEYDVKKTDAVGAAAGKSSPRFTIGLPK